MVSFLKNNYLIGLSIDSTKELHDFYRVDKGGHGSFDKVIRAANLMDKHKVDFNLLTTVHAHNANALLRYRFFRDEVRKQDLFQFIPIVERDNDTGFQEGNEVTDRSVSAEKWGKFF
ncbi:MAG: hypothetical protein R2942_17165 [Ignavibacteria bacterium]